MFDENDTKSQGKTAVGKPQVTSYDSGYEHSFEHWIEVRRMVDAEEENILVAKPRALTARA